MIQTPQDLLVYALQEIQDAEAQASQAVQNQLRLIENEELGKLLERRLSRFGWAGQRMRRVISCADLGRGTGNGRQVARGCG